MEKLIYIVEDEDNIRELISVTLNSAGFTTQCFESGQLLYKSLEIEKPQLIILDIMLPEETGHDILKKIRLDSKFKDIPVIFLTAKSAEIDKVIGLDLGADDFIVKPFGILELISRVKAVIRRYNNSVIPNTTEKIVFKDLTIDTADKSVYKNNNKLVLTYKEYELLLYLIKNKGLALSREKLLEKIWSYDFEGETRTVDSHIRSLRSKLGDNSETPEYISTLRGHGYMFVRE